MPVTSRHLALLALCVLCASPVSAQSSQSAATSAAVDRLFRISGALPTGSPAGVAVEPVLFAIYDSETGGSLLWQEMQNLAIDAQGRYAVLLGATSTDGLPVELFAGGAPRWLSVQTQGTSAPAAARTLLTSVPYALTAVNAANADSLGGRPASDYQLAVSPGPAGKGGSTAGAAKGRRTVAGAVAGPLTSGTIGRIGKFTTSVDLGNSVMTESAGMIGIGTTSPLDFLHTSFTDTTGAFTGYAVQNLGSTATSYSGMLFYDHLGALAQFQGFNNSTKEYRINNIATGGSINFMLGGASKFLVDAAGNVGVSQPTPSYKLDVLHGGGTGIRVKSSSSFSVVDIDGFSGDSALRFYNNGVTQWNIRNRPGDNYLEFFELGGGGSRMVIQDTTGYVGIGGTPTVPLEVFRTQGGIATTGSSAFFMPSSTILGTATNNTYSAVSIRGEGQILANIFAAVSDERVKNVKGHSSGAADLDTLARIEITDYVYKDAIGEGNAPQKKVIAQQVERVYPQAVSQTTDVVPDIYKKAPLHGGWIALATDLKVGERVRLVTEKGHRAVHDVLEVDAGRFRTDFAEDAEQVFVYGREVKDFRVVDYEAIAMLNVSATQELSRRLEQQEMDTASLKQELGDMRTALTAALDAVAAAAKAQQR